MRHDTISLFAALEGAIGNVLAKCYRRHRAVEFRDFLAQIDAAVPKDQAGPVSAWSGIWSVRVPVRKLHKEREFPSSRTRFGIASRVII